MAATGIAAIAVALFEAGLLIWGPIRIPGTPSYLDVLYGGLVGMCAASGLVWLRSGHRREGAPDRKLAEVLLFAALVLGLFGYIYAANANMDYVQRFAASGGNVRLAQDTRAERLTVSLRYVPIVAAGLLRWLVAGAGRRRGLEGFAFPLSLASAVAVALAYPSGMALGGLGPVAFVAYVPLFCVLSVTSYRRGVFLGTAAWTIQTMLTSSWLGTYSLISLQLVTVLLAAEGAAFFSVSLAVHRLVSRRLPAAAFVVFPLAWTVFDYLRTVGFLGYPWSLLGATQYAFVPAIQIAALTGVWGVGFVVALTSSAVAAALAPGLLSGRARIGALCAAAASLAACLLFGAAVLATPPSAVREVVRLALVQQNNDPRKNDYAATFATLQRLTGGTLDWHPDLVVWSETAFVPNIRRWSSLDPAQYPLAELVRSFLEYQKSTGTWLLTGNDDYELRQEAGEEVRLDYNASILFSPSGDRVSTYHKMRLVPFTESFPWKNRLPGLYKVLQGFDVYLWEPGAERVVFHHPSFDFCTPICFEDAFPDHVRRFILEGVDVIVNISNDYWSLTEVEARQHAANAVFRAVENRRPVVRATASGLTMHIDPVGRQLRSLPSYVEGVLVADVPLAGRPATLYTAWGDWFPALCAAALALLAAAAGLRGAARAKGRLPA